MNNCHESGPQDAQVSYQGNPDGLYFGAGWEDELRKNPAMAEHLPKLEYDFVANPDEEEKAHGNSVGYYVALGKLASQPIETEPPKE